jgi:hypothetical protein
VPLDPQLAQLSQRPPAIDAQTEKIMEREQHLAEAAAAIRAFLDAGDSAGFAGMIADGEAARLDVHWKGTAPKALLRLAAELAEDLDIAVEVNSANFSNAELLRGAQELMEGHADTASEQITMADPLADGSGLRVWVDEGEGATGSTSESVISPQAVTDHGLPTSFPVALEHGESPEPATRYTDFTSSLWTTSTALVVVQ